MRLTKVQRVFLDSLKLDNLPEYKKCWIEVLPHELRTARCLEKKGIIEMNGDFEARLIVVDEELGNA